ncbi:thiamine-phosphate diphosphorylase [Thioclava sp. SK-1]|uniref:thiamine phosphate synthase n=1 Tax=Thioclava sp. SK-1 TaxID=1889770 RepID=UPI000825D2BE|nr:thiamine phosphate synthase [Thioclava sp. SK-1]OCX66099.1 thiamine-phosphate diphosphorylase [Thioclava sp. SK-1]
MTGFGVYFVTPDGASDALILAALHGGAGMVQLRDKTATNADMIAQAQRLRPAFTAANVPLIINDRLEVALASQADGLHIGQGDGDPAQMRAALGPDRHLGLSVETLSQLHQLPPGIDLIGVGPVRATASKPDHAAPIGLAGLAQITALSPVPVVAIGGVGPADCAAIKSAGCAGMAVVSAIAGHADPESATRALVHAWSIA